MFLIIQRSYYQAERSASLAGRKAIENGLDKGFVEKNQFIVEQAAFDPNTRIFERILQVLPNAPEREFEVIRRVFTKGKRLCSSPHPSSQHQFEYPLSFPAEVSQVSISDAELKMIIAELLPFATQIDAKL